MSGEKLVYKKVSGTRIGDAIGTPIKQQTLINELIAELLTGEAKKLSQARQCILVLKRRILQYKNTKN